MKVTGIGFVGVGCISPVYLENVSNMFENIRIVGVCDLIRERAENAAEKYGIGKVYADMYELFADPEVEIVLNLTRPYEHYEVTKAALLAGKHVYSEKPLAPRFSEAKELYELAQEKGLCLGGAPDTFMGAGIQTARKLIDDGFIGVPIAGQVQFAGHGPESWHQDSEFYYQYGGGPMLDMGPYYMTALMNLLGRASEVCGMTRITFPERPMLCGPKYGNMMKVEVPTHEAGTIRFENGAIIQVLASFDVYNKGGVPIKIFGTEGTIIVPDPNNFGGEVQVLRAGEKEFKSIPLLFPYDKQCRALGLADMAEAIETGRSYRANSMQQLHLVEILNAFHTSSETGQTVRLTSEYQRQEPMHYTQILGKSYI